MPNFRLAGYINKDDVKKCKVQFYRDEDTNEMVFFEFDNTTLHVRKDAFEEMNKRVIGVRDMFYADIENAKKRIDEWGKEL